MLRNLSRTLARCGVGSFDSDFTYLIGPGLFRHVLFVSFYRSGIGSSRTPVSINLVKHHYSILIAEKRV